MLRLAAVAAIPAIVMLLGGCAPGAAPTPAPTPAFASEAEAFAAAEEVYRAYNEAGNDRRGGDKSVKPQDFLVGTALEGAIDGQNFLREHDVRLTGVILVMTFVGEHSAPSEPPVVHALVCLDLSNARTMDASGNDVTPADRPTVIAQRVTFVHDGIKLRISEEAEGDAESCPSL
ncbi:hypothetical protein HWD99_17740 [Microbacterium sp. C5A9]|uniref:hypothetical protein n=1 Tax=Microbacterium sp. C5A9 TaxID=2736663 RepID=UPI001F51CF1C|nr:hypothetical protein [Microbacterium sp. C5A9]MCI1020473.1 hypothetical protein [Microbacterium sp. C5A9]